MPDKSSEKICPESSAFLVRETPDSSAPDFLSRENGHLPEPEWHTKNLPRPHDTGSGSPAEIQLPEALAGDIITRASSSAPPPPPVDLAAADASSPAPTAKRPDTARIAPDGKPGPRRSIGLIDEPPTLAEQNTIHAVPKKNDGHPTAGIPGPTHKQPDDPASAEIVRPTGLALSDGKVLRFPGGHRFATGDLIEINQHRYQVKLQKRRPPVFYLKMLGLLLLAALAVYGVSSLSSDGQNAAVVGVVVDGTTGMVLADVEISLPDGTAKKMTNAAGIFLFPYLTPGDYSMQISKPGYTSRTVTVTAESATTAISVNLNPLFATQDESTTEETTAKKPTDGNTAAAYGALALEVDFDDYLIYLDDRIQGKNIKKIDQIQPGEHRITVEKSQYEDYHTKVEIKARRTTSLALALENLTPKTTPQQRAKTHFADGKTAMDQGSYQGAIKNFDMALAELPEYPEALQYRGWSYRKLNNTTQAGADLLAAAELFALANRYLEATSCVKYLIEMHPADSKYHILRGDYYSALGELKSAITDYEVAAELDKKSLTAQLALAEGYYRDGQYKEAAKIFEKARKLTTDPTDVYVRLILSYMYAGKDKDLVKRYREFAAIATAEKLDRLQQDPEWKRVLQLIPPEESP